MMLPTTRIVFAISDTGGGHRSAAVAIAAALHELCGAHVSCEHVDILRASGVPVVRKFPDMYNNALTRLLWLYNATFRATNGRVPVEAISWLVYLHGRQNIGRVLRELRPDLVVSTHPLTQRFVSDARYAYCLPYRVATVVTDLVSLHTAWAYGGVDLCTAPTDEAYRLLQRRGMPSHQLVRTGFPVHPKFSAYERTQAETRLALGLHPDEFTILITSGGSGAGRLQDLVLALEQRFPERQLLVVTGKNERLYNTLLRERRSPRTHIYGFVDTMHMLMAASDVVVTKAGPGTLMEALVMRRPVIVTQAVGLQERGNIDFVLNHRLGHFCPTVDEIVTAMERLTDPQQHAATVARLAGAVPRYGARQIATVLLDQVARAHRDGPPGPAHWFGPLRYRGRRKPEHQPG